MKLNTSRNLKNTSMQSSNTSFRFSLQKTDISNSSSSTKPTNSTNKIIKIEINDKPKSDKLKENINLENEIRNKIFDVEVTPKVDDIPDDSRSKSELDVIKLNKWEREKLRKEKKNEKTIKLNHLTNHEIESINYYNMVKNDMNSHIKLKNNSYVQEFYKKTSQEQGTIFLQNLNIITKRKFNFNVFKEVLHKNGQRITNPLQRRFTIVHKKEEEEKKQTEELLKDQLRKAEVILEGSLERLGGIDHYREIIREKMKIESHYKKELHNLANRICEFKLEKKHMVQFSCEAHKEIMKMENDFSDLKFEIEKEKKELNEELKEMDDNRNQVEKGLKKFISEEEYFSFQRDYAKQMLEFDEKIRKKEAEVTKKITYLLRLLEGNRKKIIDCEAHIKALKQQQIELTKQQIIYFKDILKKGFDVRNEGLVWVVKRLMELGSQVDTSMFPRFVNTEQINYILKMAKMQLETSQLKYILKILKTKQQVLNEENEDKRMRFTKYSGAKNSFNSTNKFFFSPNQTGTSFNNTNFSKATLRSFEEIGKKYEGLIMKTFESQFEQMEVTEVTEEFKEKLRKYAYDESALDPNYNCTDETVPGSRYYLDDIINLRERIKVLEEEIETTKKEQKQYFKKKPDIFSQSLGQMKSNMNYDMVYAAVFGNDDETYRKKVEKAPKLFSTIQYKLEKDLQNEKLRQEMNKKEHEEVISIPTTKTKPHEVKKAKKEHASIRYIVFENKNFDINEMEKSEEGYKYKLRFPNPRKTYLKDPNEKNRKIAMEQIMEGVFKEKKIELKKLSKVSSMPTLKKPFSVESSTNLVKKIDKNEKSKDRKSQNPPVNKNFQHLCELHNIITLDQKMDYYMLLRQNALESFPEMRIETGQHNTRNSKESGKFKVRNSESNEKSSFQKSDKRDYSFSSTSKVQNDVYQRYLNDLKAKFKNIEDINFTNNKNLENYLNDINSKFILFKENMKSFDTMSYIDKIKVVMKAKEMVNHRIILKESDINVERLCYIIYKKCIDFKIISHLDLSKNNLGDTGCQYVLYLIDQYSKYLNFLNLSYTKMGKQSSDILSNILAKNSTSINSLNISGNFLGDKQFCDMSVGISKSLSLERFWTSENSLDKASCLIIGTILRFDKKLKFLDISKNPLNDDFLHDIFKGLISNNCLEILVVNECNMTNLSFKILDVAMQLNYTLKELYLERNKLINISCEKISDIFNKNSCLEIISLIGNKIDHEGIDIILERQRKIPIKVIGIKELYGIKFDNSSYNHNLVFEFF